MPWSIVPSPYSPPRSGALFESFQCVQKFELPAATSIIGLKTASSRPHLWHNFPLKAKTMPPAHPPSRHLCRGPGSFSNFTWIGGPQLPARVSEGLFSGCHAPRTVISPSRFSCSLAGCKIRKVHGTPYTTQLWTMSTRFHLVYHEVLFGELRPKSSGIDLLMLLAPDKGRCFLSQLRHRQTALQSDIVSRTLSLFCL